MGLGENWGNLTQSKLAYTETTICCKTKHILFASSGALSCCIVRFLKENFFLRI